MTGPQLVSDSCGTTQVGIAQVGIAQVAKVQVNPAQIALGKTDNSLPFRTGTGCSEQLSSSTLDGMRRPIPRAVPCAAWVCKRMRAPCGLRMEGGSAHE